MLAAACAGGGGGGGSSGSGDGVFGEDGGTPAPPLSEGATVTYLETRAPEQDKFVLRGTIPVPPGIFPRADGKQPFTIYDYDGTPLETQTELVSRYAADAHGADVVEVIALVRRDPQASLGSRVRYEVRQSLRAAPGDPGKDGVEDLLRTQSLPADVRDLVSDPDSIRLVAYDCFGNAYQCRPFDGTGRARVLRYGPVHSEVQVYQDMLPVNPDPTGPQGTLPHLFGVHVYLSTLQGEPVVGMDVRFHNGHCGADPTTAMDDPLDKVYFERIDLEMPSAWRVEQGFEDPRFDDGYHSNGRRISSLVTPEPAGKMHVMRWQGQFHRRLMLAPNSVSEVARAYVQNGIGQGFCSRGVDPEGGHEYWSWWNRGTARYWPQKYQLPVLDHIGPGSVRSSLKDEHDWLKGIFESGTGTGNYPISSGRLGWGHPYGVAYGGMTGGNEIFLYDGVETAYAASAWGVQTYKGLLRMHTDRMPSAFYKANGEPSTVEDWLIVPENGEPYVPFEHFLHPSLSAGDPFGLTQAPRFQIQYVESSGRRPDYESAYMSFGAHDYQHFIRYTRAAKVLVWLANDSLSKDELGMQAENFRLSYHPFNNNKWGGAQGSGMRSAQDFVSDHPGVGFAFGRGEAWGIDCAVASYAVQGRGWRRARLPWFEAIARLIADGQASCSGFIQANVTPKNFNGQWRSRQQIEQSITENMLQGLRESVFRGADAARSNLVRDVLQDSLYAFVSPMAFPPGQNGPAIMTAVGPKDANQGVWCSFSQMPSGGWLGKETYQDWSCFAYGYELTGDPVFLDRAADQIGSGDLLSALERDGMKNLENRAALLALMQRLNGDI